MRSAGKVVRFDRVRGYGFISPDGGGEDVFLHVNDLDEIEKSEIRAGVRVTFGIEAGDRGEFATSVRLASEPSSSPTGFPGLEGGGSGDDEYFDVLSADEFRVHVTELLLQIRPPMNSEQVLHTRARMTEFAQKQGWLD
ncbi:MAG: cold-shock protein [Mycolicibacterium sp.]|uniref:cold-shock protein n=1 Tax=Mycolicibacterium sp. TaxID=2320850 RepID=UPI003D11D9A1